MNKTPSFISPVVFLALGLCVLLCGINLSRDSDPSISLFVMLFVSSAFVGFRYFSNRRLHHQFLDACNASRFCTKPDLQDTEWTYQTPLESGVLRFGANGAFEYHIEDLKHDLYSHSCFGSWSLHGKFLRLCDDRGRVVPLLSRQIGGCIVEIDNQNLKLQISSGSNFTLARFLPECQS